MCKQLPSLANRSRAELIFEGPYMKALEEECARLLPSTDKLWSRVQDVADECFEDRFFKWAKKSIYWANSWENSVQNIAEAYRKRTEDENFLLSDRALREEIPTSYTSINPLISIHPTLAFAADKKNSRLINIAMIALLTVM